MSRPSVLTRSYPAASRSTVSASTPPPARIRAHAVESLNGLHQDLEAVHVALLPDVADGEVVLVRLAGMRSEALGIRSVLDDDDVLASAELRVVIHGAGIRDHDHRGVPNAEPLLPLHEAAGERADDACLGDHLRIAIELVEVHHEVGVDALRAQQADRPASCGQRVGVVAVHDVGPERRGLRHARPPEFPIRPEVAGSTAVRCGRADPLHADAVALLALRRIARAVPRKDCDLRIPLR